MSDTQAGAVSIGAELILDGSDHQLLERFVARNDQAAFGELLKRYGRTVWWVCRRVLAQDQDAEDAFQAVFFVLARKAASIRKGEAVGSWLYGVAYRIAMRARKLACRRQRTEKQATEPAEAPPPWGRAACEEFQRLLDEEVERLAEKYQAPFVLCCLEGMSRSEAARELGWKEGTLSSRLAQARKLLQKRLVRRGVTLTSALTAVALGQQMASAAVPAALMQSTGDAMLTADPGAAISPSAADLAREYMRRTAPAKVATALAVLLVMLLFLGGASLAAIQLRLGTEADETPAVIEPETFLPPPVALGTPVGEQVLTVAFSPDGKRLVTAGAWNTMPGQLKIWDVATGNELAAVSRIPGVSCAVFSPDGRALATVDFSGAITLRDPITGEERTSVKGHDIGVGGVAYSSNSELLASAGLDGTVKLWGARDLQERKMLQGHSDRASSVAFFSHGQTMITGSHDRTAKIWDVQTGKEKFTLKGHASAIEAVTVSGDDKFVATASSDQTVRLWDAETGKETAVLGGEKDQAFFAVAFSPDGKFLAAAGRDGAIRLWNIKTRQSIGALGKHTDAVWALAFSCDGVLASGSSDKSAKLWRLKGTGEVATLKASWSATRPIHALAYASDGKVFAVATKDTTVHLRDAKSGDVAMVLPGHAGEVTCLAFAPEGQTLVSGSVDKTVKLWDRATGAEIRTFSHTGAVHALAFAPDGKKFASAGDDKIIRIWDAVSGKDLAMLQGHEAPIRALAFATDGGSIASGGADGTIKIWDLVTKMEARSLQGHKGTVGALTFSSDGVLASAGADTSVKLWDASKGLLRFTLEGHTAAVLALAFSPKGRTLTSGSQDATVRVWDPVSGQSRGILKRHKDAVTGVAIHPHGHNLVSGSHDTLLLRWQAGNSAMASVGETPSVPKSEDAAPKYLSRTSDKQEAEPNVQATPRPQAPTAMRRGWLLGAVLAFGFLASIGVAVSLFVRSARGREAGGLLASAPRTWLTAAALCVFFFAAVGIAGTVFLAPPQEGSSVSHLDKLLGTEPTPGIEEEGFYGTEVSTKSGSASRWTNGMAKMIVPLHGPAPKAVRVRLAIPSLRPVVNIRINGQSVFKERVARDNWTETFDLSATKLGKELTLEVLSDTFVPAEKNKNSTDERTLGVRVLGITLLSEASFQKADLETFVVYGEGFFGQERNDVHAFRWIGDRLPKEAPVPIEGIVKLRNTRKDMFLKIVGDVPVYAMREPPTLRIKFNGEVLEEFVPAKRKLDKFYKVAAAKQSKAEYSELRVTCSTFFIPAEYYKKSTDDRRMCFRVFRLTWADKEEDLNTSEVPVPAAPVTPPTDPPNAGASNSGLRSWIWLVLLIGMGLAVALVLILAVGLLVAKRRAAKTAASSIAMAPPEDPVPFIAFTCSECGKKLKTKSGMAGKKVKCSKCGKAVLVPPVKAGET